MNVFADESVDRPIVDRLRQDGHNVIYVAELAASISDDVVLATANSQGALLLTVDKDFGELVFRQSRAHGGIVLVRLLGVSAALKADIVAETFRDRALEMQRAFTVISAGTVRIRRYP
jgi:predicted nuclease of predicted toxin-antitoxin system